MTIPSRPDVVLLDANYRIIGWSFGLCVAMCVVAFWYMDHDITAFARTLSGETGNLARSWGRLGDAKPYLAVGIVLWLVAAMRKNCRYGRKIACFGRDLWVVIALSGIAVNLAKLAFARARPRVWEQGLDGLFYFDRVLDSAFRSFPSGHSATAGAAAMVIALHWPRLRIPMVVLALWVGATRVITVAHYLSDVVLGLYLGGLVAWLWFASRLRARWGGR